MIVVEHSYLCDGRTVLVWRKKNLNNTVHGADIPQPLKALFFVNLIDMKSNYEARKVKGI